MRTGEKESFESHYAELYGDQWPQLRDALHQGGVKAFRLNRFVFGDQSSVWTRGNLDYPWAPECIDDWSALSFSESLGEGALEAAYLMDPASIVVARALGVEGGMSVLDMCAAPGGKALILAEAIRDAGSLVANELSRARRFKLLSILKRYVPEDVLGRIQVTGWDASKVGLKQEGRFDRILVDAPCSAEGHLLGRATELERWTPSRTRQLSRRQYGILCSALLAVRPGGRIVYATCSISQDENDQVIQRLIKRKGQQIRVVPVTAPLGESTTLGWQILPDRHRAGPAYFSLIERIS